MESIFIKSSTITINVINLDLSIEFYNSIGLTLQKRWDNHYAEMSASGIVIGLHPVEDSSKVKGSGSTSIGFISENFEKAKSILSNLKIPFKERQEEGGKFLHFSDPDDTALYFIEPKW